MAGQTLLGLCDCGICAVYKKMINFNIPTVVIFLHFLHIKQDSMQLVCQSVLKTIRLNVTAFLQTLTSHSSIL